MSGERETLLVGYVRQALAKLDAGEQVDPAALCGAHPDLAAPLAEALGLAEALPELHDQARSTDPLAGLVLSERYQLETRIGSGAMGVVYRGRDRELGRPVAVKILDARILQNAEAEQRFARESELLASLQHPHVVHIHDRGRSDIGVLYIVMEHLEGVSLADVVEEISEGGDGVAFLQRALGGDPPEESLLRLCVRWAADLASGLEAAHAAGVFHRDVKPSNIFICSDYRAVLLDFGIAVRDTDSRLTATQTTLGTPWYMAPEQAMGEPAHASMDVYGLTATLYHLLTGKPPFDGEPAEVLLLLQTSNPTPPGVVRPSLPRDVQAILEKGIEIDLRRRYGTVAALEADLRAFLAHRPVSARPLSAAGRWWRRVRRNPARPVAAAAMVVLVLGAVLAVPVWLADEERARLEEKERLTMTLPSLLALEGSPDQRLLAFLGAERGQSIELLTRILELDPEDLPMRLWRAALYLDQGDHDAAARDLDELAARCDSGYVRAVAQKYLAAEKGARGVESVDLTGLPTPATDEERFVAGFHELRNRHVRGYEKRAQELLQKAGERYLPARDLHLIALLARGDRDRDQARKISWFRKAHEESLTLEGIYGYATARTLAVRGASLIMMKQYEDAVAPLHESLRLRPGRHGPLHNLGVAYRRLGQLDEAMKFLRQAEEMRPHFWNTTYTLAQVYRDRGDFEKAYEFAERVPSESSGVGWRRHALIANIALYEANAMLPIDAAAAAGCAARAVEAYDRAIALAPSASIARRLQPGRGAASALGEANLEMAAARFLEDIRRDPQNPYHISSLANLLPESLDAETTHQLRLFLHTLAHSLAKGDAALKRRQEEEFERAQRQRR